MGLREWFRRTFSSGLDDEAAEREEYGLQDRGELEVDRDRYSGEFAGSEAAEAAKDELDSLKRPRDPNP